MDNVASYKLFDIVTRQSLYIEQVKMGEANEFSNVLFEIEEEFKRLLPRLKYDNLNDLNKAQLNVFIKDLRVSQTRIYSRYQRQLLERLKEFMEAATTQTIITSASFYAHTFEDVTDEDAETIELLSVEESLVVVEEAMKENDSSSLFGFAVLGGTAAAFALLWSRIKNTVMPSGGALPVDYINVAIAKAMLDVENAVRNAWANKKTVAELKADVIGGIVKKTLADGTKQEDVVKGVLARVNNAMRGVLATTMQHVAQQSLGAVNSAIWPEYAWVSIIDGVTSDICRLRNGRTWAFGEGPLPPAHSHCRSHVSPTDGFDPSFVFPSFFDWLKAQPEPFISDVFGSTIGAKFKDGTIKRSDFDKFKPSTSKTVAEFLAGTSNLI